MSLSSGQMHLPHKMALSMILTAQIMDQLINETLAINEKSQRVFYKVEKGLKKASVEGGKKAE